MPCSVAKGTKAAEDAAQHLMDYANSNPDAEIKFRAYLVEPDARSRPGGFHFLGSRARAMLSGPTHALAKTIQAAMASAMEAEMKALFMNAQLLVEYRQALEDMGHPQPLTRARAGSKPARGALAGAMKQKRAKPAGMSATWAKGRCEQGQFELQWGSWPHLLGW